MRNSLILISLVYVFTAKGHLETSDTEYSVRTSLSIIQNGSLLIDAPDQEAIKNFPSTSVRDKIYSPYGIGLSLIFIPITLVGILISQFFNFDQRLATDFLLSFYNIPFAIIALYFFYKILMHLGCSSKRASLMMSILAIGTCFWKYTVTDFSEITQACCVLGIIYNMLGNKYKKWLYISFWYSLLITVKLTYFIFFPFLIIFFIIENKGVKFLIIRKKFLFASTIVVPVCLLIAFLNYYRFNDILESGYGKVINFSYVFFKRDWYDYLISTERGILSFNPLFFLSIVGLIFIPRGKRVELTVIGITVLVWYLTMCFWCSWQGGYCWGNRLLTPIAPLLLIPVAFIPIKNYISKIILIFVTLISVLIQFSASFTKIHEIIEIKLKIQELTGQPSDNQLLRGIKLFFHKLTTPEAKYLASDFGTQSTEIINLTIYNSFDGFNLWIVHFLNHLGLKPFSYWAGIIVLSFSILMCITLFRINRNNNII